MHINIRSLWFHGRGKRLVFLKKNLKIYICYGFFNYILHFAHILPSCLGKKKKKKKKQLWYMSSTGYWFGLDFEPKLHYSLCYHKVVKYYKHQISPIQIWIIKHTKKGFWEYYFRNMFKKFSPHYFFQGY